VQERARGPLSPCQVWWGSDFTRPPGGQNVEFLPAALRAAQACRYLIYSEAEFEVFRPAGATRCTDGVKFGTDRRGPSVGFARGVMDRRSPPPCQISPPSVQRQGCRPPKLKFLLRFGRTVEYKRPAGAYPSRDFYKICRVCTPFQMR